MIPTLSIFLSGGLCIGYFVASLFFLKYWRASKDMIFLTFALAFALLGIERAVVTLIFGDETDVPAAYLFRLVAFCLIIAGIVVKNRRR